MPRYPHYLYPSGDGKWPKRIIIVSCVSKIDRQKTRQSAVVHTLRSWHAIALSGEKHAVGVTRTASGNTADGFWDLLTTISDIPGMVWIVSGNAARDWSLLGLWERLENGHCTLDAKDYRSADSDSRLVSKVRQAQGDKLGPLSGSKLHAMREHGRGYLVCENPPNICRFRIGLLPCSWHWIDSRNHGVSVPSTVGDGATAASWLSEWWIEASMMLHHYRLGAWCATAGSQAIVGWRRGYHVGGVQVHCRPDVLEMEGQSYYGGRCECYRIGDIPDSVYHLDIRSMYPSVCAQERIPARLMVIAGSPEESVEIVKADPCGCLARVTVRTDEPAYPYTGEQGIIWPVGLFETTLAGPELADAYYNGRIDRVHAAVRYDREYWLSEYAKSLYRFRCEAEESGKPGLAAMAKTLLVTLPGKFGQREHRWEDCPMERPIAPWGEWYGANDRGETCRYRALAWHVQRDIVTGFSADAVPAAASWITSFGRMRLLALIRLALWHNVYYVDTDSLIVSESGLRRLRAAGVIGLRTLGALELRVGPVKVSIAGQKWYTENGALICSGMPTTETVQTADGMHYWRELSPGEQIRCGVRPDTVATLHRWERMRQYMHGSVQPDGSVLPIRIGA